MSVTTSHSLVVHLPEAPSGGLDQDEEWCEVELEGERRRIRFHDYDEVYAIPGLYEHLFYERLKCESPTVVTDLLLRAIRAAGEDPAALRVLDLGAGNGMVGEALRERGFEDVVGVDIVPEAGEAVVRDRPGVYSAYHVCDLLSPSEETRCELAAGEFGAMTSVAALGFGDVPPAVFGAAFDLVGDGGWVGFNIKEDFLTDTDPSGFSAYLRGLLAGGRLEERGHRRYRHRLDVRGRPLHYVAMAGIKRG